MPVRDVVILITREQSDAFALDSQKAKAAIDAGRFSREIAPVVAGTGLQAGPYETIVDRDEHPRGDTTIEILRKLPPVFGAVEGTPGIITAEEWGWRSPSRQLGNWVIG